MHYITIGLPPQFSWPFYDFMWESTRIVLDFFFIVPHWVMLYCFIFFNSKPNYFERVKKTPSVTTKIIITFLFSVLKAHQWYSKKRKMISSRLSLTVPNKYADLLAWLENPEIRDLCRDLLMTNYFLYIQIFILPPLVHLKWDWILGRKWEWRKKTSKVMQRGLGVNLRSIIDSKLAEFLDETTVGSNITVIIEICLALYDFSKQCHIINLM